MQASTVEKKLNAAVTFRVKKDDSGAWQYQGVVFLADAKVPVAVREELPNYIEGSWHAKRADARTDVSKWISEFVDEIKEAL